MVVKQKLNVLEIMDIIANWENFIFSNFQKIEIENLQQIQLKNLEFSAQFFGIFVCVSPSFSVATFANLPFWKSEKCFEF